MPLLALLLGLIFPRLIIFFLWLLTNWFHGVVDWVFGLLGFIFLPYTLLWYSVVMNWYGGVWDFWQIAILVLAILSDIGSPFGSRKRGW